MKKEYVLIQNEKYKLTIFLDKPGFDYYTDVFIKLTFDEQSIILFKDNLLALKNIIDHYNGNIDILDNNLDESKLGILLNDYYRGFYGNKHQNNLILDNNGYWIGEKYCCYSNQKYATWIYCYGGNIVIKVTTVFGGFGKEGYAREYYKFIQKYKDTFRGFVSLQQLTYAKKVIFQLYDELF